MGGWRYEWVGSLPMDVYEVLLDMLKREADEREREQP
jgi:hypothetical protein